jgi:hypothetical protein
MVITGSYKKDKFRDKKEGSNARFKSTEGGPLAAFLSPWQ